MRWIILFGLLLWGSLAPSAALGDIPDIEKMTDLELLSMGKKILLEERQQLKKDRIILEERKKEIDKQEQALKEEKADLELLKEYYLNLKKDQKKINKNNFWTGFFAGGITGLAAGGLSGFTIGFRLRL